MTDMKIQRLIYILLMLEGKQKITAKELAEKSETSIRTIYRDIEILCQAGVPIYTESGPHGGISLMENYQIPWKHLYKDDIVSLYLNHIGVKTEQGSNLDLQMETTLKKIEKAMSDKETKELHEIGKRFYVDSTPWWGKKVSMIHSETVIQAVSQSRKLKIVYVKMNQEESLRIIHPYGVVIKSNIWYLIGYCEVAKSIRTFRCERIKECNLLDQCFEYPDDFHLKEHFDQSMAAFKEDCHLIEQYIVTLLVPISALSLLEDLEYSIEKTMEDSIMLHVNFNTYENAIRDYWNILIQSTVIEPQKLRDDIRNKLKKAFNLYE